MPVKFKPSQTTFVKGKGKVTQNFFIKNVSQDELFDYINKGQKNKIKQDRSNYKKIFVVNLVEGLLN